MFFTIVYAHNSRNIILIIIMSRVWHSTAIIRAMSAIINPLAAKLWETPIKVIKQREYLSLHYTVQKLCRSVYSNFRNWRVTVTNEVHLITTSVEKRLMAVKVRTPYRYGDLFARLRATGNRLLRSVFAIFCLRCVSAADISGF